MVPGSGSLSSLNPTTYIGKKDNLANHCRMATEFNKKM